MSPFLFSKPNRLILNMHVTVVVEHFCHRLITVFTVRNRVAHIAQ